MSGNLFYSLQADLELYLELGYESLSFLGNVDEAIQAKKAGGGFAGFGLGRRQSGDFRHLRLGADLFPSLAVSPGYLGDKLRGARIKAQGQYVFYKDWFLYGDFSHSSFAGDFDLKSTRYSLGAGLNF